MLSTMYKVTRKLHFWCKGHTKQTQNFTATFCNFVARKVLHKFGHPVAQCYNMLHDVRSSLKMV